MISVLIPTYRRRGQLAECLESLALQPFKDIEVLVGDDSPENEQDDNARVLRDYALSSGMPVTYIQNRPSRGNYPNQWNLAEQAAGEYILILHDDDRILPNGLNQLSAAATAESDPRVDLWFGRNRIIDERGNILHKQTVEAMEKYGKAGDPEVRPVSIWALTHSIPPDGFLIRKATYLAHMRGARDGNVGDWGLSVRLANANVFARFIGTYTSEYRVQVDSNTGRGTDVHLMYELAKTLAVSPENNFAKFAMIVEMAPTALRRYIKNGETERARRVLREDLTYRQRLQPRQLAMAILSWAPPPLSRQVVRFVDRRRERYPRTRDRV